MDEIFLFKLELTEKQIMEEMYLLNDDDLQLKLKAIPGVYLLYCVIDEKVKFIPRVLGVDVDGRLYIGKSKNLKKRVLQLKSRIFYSKAGHSGGSRYNSNEALNKAFPKDCLHIRIISDNDPTKAEKRLLYNYIKEFGELPPLNRQR